jgi:hypothetical protein
VDKNQGSGHANDIIFIAVRKELPSDSLSPFFIFIIGRLVSMSP